jgi:hypothetical protein
MLLNIVDELIPPKFSARVRTTKNMVSVLLATSAKRACSLTSVKFVSQTSRWEDIVDELYYM